MRKFDAALGASLEKLASAHRAWAAAGSCSAPLLVDGSPIEDLCLSFVLPGALLYGLVSRSALLGRFEGAGKDGRAGELGIVEGDALGERVARRAMLQLGMV